MEISSSMWVMQYAVKTRMETVGGHSSAENAAGAKVAPEAKVDGSINQTVTI